MFFSFPLLIINLIIDHRENTKKIDSCRYDLKIKFKMALRLYFVRTSVILQVSNRYLACFIEEKRQSFV